MYLDCRTSATPDLNINKPAARPLLLQVKNYKEYSAVLDKLEFVYQQTGKYNTYDSHQGDSGLDKHDKLFGAKL